MLQCNLKTKLRLPNGANRQNKYFKKCFFSILDRSLRCLGRHRTLPPIRTSPTATLWRSPSNLRRGQDPAQALRLRLRRVRQLLRSQLRQEGDPGDDDLSQLILRHLTTCSMFYLNQFHKDFQVNF